MEKKDLIGREPSWVVPPSVVVSGPCNDVELDFAQAAFPEGQQRSMVSVPGDCSQLTLKVPEAVLNVRDSATVSSTSSATVKYLWGGAEHEKKSGEKWMLNWAQNTTRQERHCGRPQG